MGGGKKEAFSVAPGPESLHRYGHVFPLVIKGDPNWLWLSVKIW